MSSSPFIQFYTSDFLAGTGGMTASVKGVYITLLCLMYEAEGPLPQTWETLARRCGCTLPAFRRAVESLTDDGKIETLDAGLWSPKCEKHIALRRERQQSATSAAKTRWEKDKQKQGKPDAIASIPQCQPEPYREDSVAKATDASVDFAKQLFDRGVAFLGRHGTPDKQARSVIGKWRKAYQDTDIFDAFSACSKEGAVDPIPWIAARLNGRSKPNGTDKGQRKLDAFIAGSTRTPKVDRGPDIHPSVPLLARG